MKGKKLKLILLGLLTVVIWTFIFVNVYSNLVTDTEETVSVDITANEVQRSLSGKNKPKEMREIFNDPFKLGDGIVTADTENNTPVQKPVPQFTEYVEYEIKGTIIRKNYKTVLLQNLRTGELLTLKEGETYKSLKVVSINVNEVTILANNNLVKHNILDLGNAANNSNP